jgi:hypothetical protein
LWSRVSLKPHPQHPDAPAAAERVRLVARNPDSAATTRNSANISAPAVTTIRKLTLAVHRLHAELEASSKVTPIGTKARTR